MKLATCHYINCLDKDTRVNNHLDKSQLCRGVFLQFCKSIFFSPFRCQIEIAAGTMRVGINITHQTQVRLYIYFFNSENSFLRNPH